MTSSKSTKRALISSTLAILMCVAMLIGTTFAWFTDTASTGVNKIVSGNLKVDIIRAESDSHIEKLNFTKAAMTDAEAGAEILWEPGCRYLTEGFRIANKGNLALKWKAEINKDNIVDGKVEGSTIAKDGKSLLDVIDFYVVTKAADGTETAVAIEDFVGNLIKGAKSDVYYIKGVMQTTAGNDYQDLTLDGITITVVATQDTVENDSFNNQYDKDAQYPITSFADLKAAVEWNGKYNVTEDLDPDASLIIKNAVVTLNATGKTIANIQDIYNAATYDWSMISVRGWMGNLTITGGTFAAKENDCFVMDVRDGGYLTIEDGKFIGNEDAIYVDKGTAVIEGGFFDIQQKSSGSTLKEQYKTLLNCQNANYNAGKAKIIVKGGTFVNFDPSNNPEGEGTSFVADGYKVVSETQTNGDVWYTVVPR